MREDLNLKKNNTPQKEGPSNKNESPEASKAPMEIMKKGLRSVLVALTVLTAHPAAAQSEGQNFDPKTVSVDADKCAEQSPGTIAGVADEVTRILQNSIDTTGELPHYTETVDQQTQLLRLRHVCRRAISDVEFAKDLAIAEGSETTTLDELLNTLRENVDAIKEAEDKIQKKIEEYR